MLKLSSPETGDYWEVPVLFEDEHLLALDKPAGLLTAPDRFDPKRPNLMRLLHAHMARRVPWARDRDLTYLANAHRLDFETSGVLLLAKTKPVLVQLANQFGSEKPVKVYFALTRGVSAQDTFSVEIKLAPHPRRPGLMRRNPAVGKRSRTEFCVRQRFRAFTWMECRPLTERSHQIRVHLSVSKLPLVGDSDYGGSPLWLSAIKPGYRCRGDGTERPLMSRVALHAARLELAHPLTGDPVRIESPLPKDLRVALKYLEQYATVELSNPPLDAK